jgi:hypothetical protein
MSDLIPTDLEQLLCSELAVGTPFRIHFEYVRGELQVVLIRTPIHCATCQCERSLNPVMPRALDGSPRKRSWHHD